MIGVQYTVTALFFMFVGGALAEVIRAELAQPGQQVVDPNTYNGLFSVHASLMIFLVIIPIFAGLANFVLPLMIGAPDMAFPRLNALSYWLLPVAGVMMMSSFLVPGRAAPSTRAGRPTRRYPTTRRSARQFFTIGVQFAGTSSIMTALNFLVTIITMRAPGMTFWRMPLLVWANFTTSLLVVIATPFVAGSQFLVLIDRALHANFFDATQGGDVISYQHIFWFYSHPAVYIMMLPGLRDHLGGHLDQGAQADLRLPPDGALAAGDPRARLHGLGAPHVRVGHVDLAARPDDDHDDADRGADRHQDLLLAGDAVARRARAVDADAVRARLHHDVHARRDQRHHAGRDPGRHPHVGHVLRGRAHPLRAVRRQHVHDLRRASTTGSRR